MHNFKELFSALSKTKLTSKEILSLQKVLEDKKEKKLSCHNRITNEEKLHIAKLVKDGFSEKDIMLATGRSRSTITDVKKDFLLSKKNARFSDLDKKQMYFRFKANGESLSSIARLYNCSPTTVKRAVKYYSTHSFI